VAPLSSVTSRSIQECGFVQRNSFTVPATTWVFVRSIPAPITHYAPELARLRVLRDPDGPLEHAEETERPLTFGDLLTHRSGLTYGINAQLPTSNFQVLIRGSRL
jgi:hypothetical protein